MANKKSLSRVTTIPDDAVEIFGGAYRVDREGNFYRHSTTNGTREGYKLRPYITCRGAGKKIVRLQNCQTRPYYVDIDVDLFIREVLPKLFNDRG